MIKMTKFKAGDIAYIPDAVYEYFRHPSKILAIKGDEALLNVPDDNPVKVDSLVKAEKECQCKKCREYRE